MSSASATNGHGLRRGASARPGALGRAIVAPGLAALPSAGGAQAVGGAGSDSAVLDSWCAATGGAIEAEAVSLASGRAGSIDGAARGFGGALGDGAPNVGGRGGGGAIGALVGGIAATEAAGGAATAGAAAPVGFGVHARAGVVRAGGGLGRVVAKDEGAGVGFGLVAADAGAGRAAGAGFVPAAAAGGLGGAAGDGFGLAAGASGADAAGALAGAGCAPYSASRRAIAWSSAASSPEISASGIGGWMERNWPISALRARS